MANLCNMNMIAYCNFRGGCQAAALLSYSCLTLYEAR